MLKIWTTGVNEDAFVLTSVSIRIERSPGAAYVADREGIPHRIAGAVPPRAVRLFIGFPENLLALENSQPISFRNYLAQVFLGGGLITIMESTEGKAWQGYIEELDPRVGARRDRLRDEDDFAHVAMWLSKRGTFDDWDDLASVTWED